MQESKSCALPLGDSPIKKGGYRDSNPGPPEPQSGALTNCAIPTILYEFVCKLFALAAPATSLQNICSSSAEGLPPHHLCAEMKNVLGGIRTPDPRLRRPLLYPTELRTHIQHTQAHKGYFNLYFPVCQHFFQQRLNFFYHITFPKHLQQENAKNQPF